MLKYMKELETEFILTLPLSGVKKEAIQLKVENNILMVEAPREVLIDETFKVLHQEFETKKEIRLSFNLGNDVNQEGISAKMEQGNLIVHLPKKPEALAKQINIA